MELHKSREIVQPLDISTLWNKLKPIWSLRAANEGSNYAAGFMHLCAGYDCGYYG
jgi:Zn-dependent oligopeptidase